MDRFQSYIQLDLLGFTGGQESKWLSDQLCQILKVSLLNSLSQKSILELRSNMLEQINSFTKEGRF